MKKRFSYILMVLLAASAALDDQCAAATPCPDDDVLAARNNDFTRSAPRHPHSNSRKGAEPLPGGLGALVALSSTPALHWGGPLGQGSCQPARPPLLYLLMSLQR